LPDRHLGSRPRSLDCPRGTSHVIDLLNGSSPTLRSINTPTDATPLTSWVKRVPILHPWLLNLYLCWNPRLLRRAIKIVADRFV
jgi:hypothetical protein